MTKTAVSVCIVDYNCKDDINKCLSSLFENTDTSKIDLQIFISDNNSTDKSNISLAKEFPSITLIKNQKNAGYGYGHNKVLKLLDSKYHIILNPDIIFKTDVIATLVKFMDENNNVAIVTPEIRNFDNTIQHLPKRYPNLRFVMSSTLPFLAKYRIPYTMADKPIKSPTEIQICTGSFMMVRTNIFKKIGGFDEQFFMYFEDFDLSMRAKKTVKSFIILILLSITPGIEIQNDQLRCLRCN